MGSISNYLENELLDHVLGVGAYSPSAAVYLALSTADPTEDGSGTSEPTYTGYNREAITFGAAASRTVTQSGAVTFDPATGGTDTVTHWAIFSALSGGNMLAYGALAVAKEIVAGNTPSVPSGEVEIYFDPGGFSDYAVHNLLDLAFRNVAYSSPSPSAALFTTDCSDSAAGTEVSGGSYARDAVTFSVASGGASSNSTLVEFPTATGSWGTITAIGLVDGSGNLLAYDNSITEQAVTTGDVVTVPIGDLDVTLN